MHALSFYKTYVNMFPIIWLFFFIKILVVHCVVQTGDVWGQKGRKRQEKVARE